MPTNTQLEALVKELDNRVSELSKEVKSLEEKIATPKTTQTPEAPKLEQSPASIAFQDFNKYPVPMDYRNIVDTVLNASFGLGIEPSSDSPVFTIRIVVPDKYSSLNTEEKRMLGADFRVKVINYAQGANGVREYAELVYKSFNPEIQAMIAADRIRAVN